MDDQGERRLDIADFNARWLAAWSRKDVEGLCAFYAEDCFYADPQTPAGLQGRTALSAYLTGLFAATPAMTYRPDAVWPIKGGFCGRWICEVAGASRLRGFDLVLLKDGLISHNEVYVHTLA